MAKIFSGKVFSVAEFPSVGILKGAFYFNTTTGTCKVAVSDEELKDINISDAYVQIAGETPMTLAQWIANIGQDFNGLEHSVAEKVAIANIHTGKEEGTASASTKVASKAYVDQEVAAAVTGGVEGLASQDWVSGQIDSAKGELNAAIGGNTTAINNHIADKNNPHGVTPAQIGAATTDALGATDAKVSALETKTTGLTVVDGKINIDGVSVASAIASKVDQSAYDTKMGEIAGSLANKLEASDIAQLNTDVEGLKTATGNLGTELGKKADKDTVELQLSSKVNQSAYDEKVTELTNAINSKEGAITVTADKALISDASGKVAASSVSAVELGYLSGVTSSVQEQINGAVAAAGTAETNAKGYADSQIASAKTELQGYADQAEADAISAANGYTDGKVTELQGYADQAEADAIASAKDYTDAEVKKVSDKVDAIEHFAVEVVESLESVTEPKSKTIYLVAVEGRQSSKAEYLYVNGGWEMIGTTDVDLSLYSTTEQMNSAISSAASGAQSAAESTAAGYTDAQVAAAKGELEGSISTLSGTVADNKTAAENAIAAVESKFSNGELVEGSKTLSVGTWKFVSADRSKAVIYEVVDAAANTVYVEVLRGSDFVTLAGLNASAEGSFYVYYLG